MAGGGRRLWVSCALKVFMRSPYLSYLHVEDVKQSLTWNFWNHGCNLEASTILLLPRKLGTLLPMNAWYSSSKEAWYSSSRDACYSASNECLLLCFQGNLLLFFQGNLVLLFQGSLVLFFQGMLGTPFQGMLSSLTLFLSLNLISILDPGSLTTLVGRSKQECTEEILPQTQRKETSFSRGIFSGKRIPTYTGMNSRSILYPV